MASDGTPQHAVGAVEYFQLLAREPLPDIDIFRRAVKTLVFEHGESLYEAGVPHPYTYVLRSGSTRTVVRDDGRDWVVGFNQPPEMVGDIVGLRPRALMHLVDVSTFMERVQAETPFGLTTTPTKAIGRFVADRIDYRVIEVPTMRHLAWSHAYETVLSLLALIKSRREREFLIYTPEERYRRFLIDYPGIADLALQKDIAAFLGITEVGLSRIVRRIRQEESDRTKNSAG